MHKKHRGYEHYRRCWRFDLNLITGMPRTASSFLVMWFAKEGDSMMPKHYSEHMATEQAKKAGLNLNLCEPIQLTHKMTQQIMPKRNIISELKLIQDSNAEDAGDRIQVLKNALFVFNRNCLDQFEKVIVCVRDIDTWVESAKNHGSFAWINGARPKWLEGLYYDIINAQDPYREFGKVWLRESLLTYEHCINAGIPCDVYEYDSDLSFKKLHLSYGLDPKTHKDYSYYIGRRF